MIRSRKPAKVVGIVGWFSLYGSDDQNLVSALCHGRTEGLKSINKVYQNFTNGHKHNHQRAIKWSNSKPL